jgi:nicotinamide-nucleotide amidase
LDAIINDIIVGFEEEETIEVLSGKMLKQQQKTLATAESCRRWCIDINFDSRRFCIFQRGVVSYAEAKTDMLRDS